MHFHVRFLNDRYPQLAAIIRKRTDRAVVSIHRQSVIDNDLNKIQTIVSLSLAELFAIIFRIILSVYLLVT